MSRIDPATLAALAMLENRSRFVDILSTVVPE